MVCTKFVFTVLYSQSGLGVPHTLEGFGMSISVSKRSVYFLLLSLATSYWGVGQKSFAATLEVCFVPGQNCAEQVASAIDRAESQVLVQAYGFTSPPILAALVKSKKSNRDVRIILDKSNEEPRYTGATFAQNGGIDILIDDKVAIAHNKIIIIDGKHVIGGSFNYTGSAQNRNAENVIFVWDNPEFAQKFIANWDRRAAVSRPYVRPTSPAK